MINELQRESFLRMQVSEMFLQIGKIYSGREVVLEIEKGINRYNRKLTCRHLMKKKSKSFAALVVGKSHYLNCGML